MAKSSGGPSGSNMGRGTGGGQATRTPASGVGGGQATRNASGPDSSLRALGFPGGAPKGMLAPGTMPPTATGGANPKSTGQMAQPGRQGGRSEGDPKA